MQFNWDNKQCNHFIHDLEFSSDGMKLIVVQSRDTNLNGADGIHVFNLTSPYDISTCTEFKKQIILIILYLRMEVKLEL